MKHGFITRDGKARSVREQFNNLCNLQERLDIDLAWMRESGQGSVFFADTLERIISDIEMLKERY